MTVAGYEIVPFRPGHADGVARLQTEIWSGDVARNRRYLAWKYGAHPFAAPLWVALHDGEVVAMRGAVGQPWCRGGAVTSATMCLQASDAMVHPAHRRQGLFRATTEAMLAGLGRAAPPFINLSSYVTSAAGYQDLGWRTVGSWAVAHRDLTPRRPDALGPGDADGRPTPFAVLDIHGRRGLPSKIALATRARPQAMAQLVARGIARRPGDRRLRPVRGPRFYAWRYRNPLAEYRLLFLGDRPLRGFLALQFPVRATRARINVVEWEADTAHDKALLLEAAMGWGDLAGLTVWSSGFDADEARILAGLGFAQLDHASAGAHGFFCPQLLVRPGRAPFAADLGAPARWQVPGIASDNF